jgi:hypothetical protein
MSLTNFSNLDFDQIKTTLKAYLRSNSNFTDYDFEGSNLSTILDVLAYNTYITSYNANMVANEVFIDSATLRENVVSLARNIGYTPRSRKASRATVSFFVADLPENISTLTLKKGVVASTTRTFGNQSFVFSILEDITKPVFDNIATFNDIEIYEGSLITSKFTYNSNNPNQKFILPNSGIDTSLLSVEVTSNDIKTKYYLHNNIFDVTKDSRVFFIQEIEDERYELIFGDGVFGAALNDGDEITASYIVSNGSSANGISRFSFAGILNYISTNAPVIVTSGISLLSTGLISSGGEEIESVESIRKYAPRIYSSQNRAITSNDYESLVKNVIYPETESISVFGGEELVPPQYGKVFISIKPRTGDFLPNITKENIKSKLKSYAVAGIVPEILDLKYLNIEVDSKVYYNTNLSSNPNDVLTQIQNNVERYADSTELNKYGARFKYSKFLKIIDESHRSITSNITRISIRRDVRVSLNTFATYSIGFGNIFNINNQSGYNIRSSAFKISGITEQVYISDIPGSNQTTGSIFLFTLPSPTSTTPTIVRRNVGTIDYEQGIININPINITSTEKIVNGQSVIQISATPKSNDVIGLQDLYLQLDSSNSLFEMVIDEVSSGLDPSASNFIVSSSYTNGNLVRL